MPFFFYSFFLFFEEGGLIHLWIRFSFPFSPCVPIVNRHVHYASVMFKEYNDLFYQLFPGILL